ncbi:DUF885 domain-containing protein [Kocuria varians]|uniref:DUF885 domain-containing protein n=1 Tax=Kocuria varians TaxID=1272 RepID=UPI000A48B739
MSTPHANQQPLPPLGSVQRTATAVDELAETYFQRCMDLDPSTATFNGIPGHESEYPDFGPAGREARAELARTTLAQLDRAEPEDDVDRVTLHALRNELELQMDRHRANLDVSEVNNIESPVQSIRQILDAMPRETEQDWRHLAARMANIPAALDQYREGLREAVSLDRRPAAPQIVEAAQQAEQYASKDGSFAALAADPAAPGSVREDLRRSADAARAAYREIAESLRGEFSEGARESSASGPEDYALHLASFLGARLDPREVYDWGVQQLLALDAEQRDLAEQIRPGASIQEAMAALNEDPARQLHSPEELREWMQGLSDAALDALAGSHFEITEQMRTLECCIAPTHDGIIYYTPPSGDFSRPGRMWWSVPEGVTQHNTWEETTTVYHEGVPGHHLQCATALANAGELNAWRRMGIWVSGHGEGWALYAERLMAELSFLDDPGDRMGMLDSQRLRTVRVIFDVGFHCGFEIPEALGEMLGGARAGQTWTPEDGWKFLRHNVAMAESTLRFEWLRYMGWPGQAPSYKVGQQMWLDAREQAMAREGESFDLERFHSRALRLGSVGLDTLTYALAL